MELTHASFFSGVGGLDLGLGRAGWATVSFSEIDRASGDDVIGTLDTGFGHHGGATPLQNAYAGHYIAATLNSGGNSGGFRTEPGEHLVMAPAFSKRPSQQLATRDDGLSSLTSGEPPRVMSINENQRGEVRSDEMSDSIKTGGGKPGQGYAAAITAQGVRRLTPVECERLMGWPDGWTIPNEWKGKTYDGSDLLPLGLDSHRYRCCGNGVVAPVAQWIGQRLADAMRALEHAA